MNKRRDLIVRITARATAPDGDLPPLAPLIDEALRDELAKGGTDYLSFFEGITHPNGVRIVARWSNWYGWRSWWQNAWDWLKALRETL